MIDRAILGIRAGDAFLSMTWLLLNDVDDDMERSIVISNGIVRAIDIA